MACVENVIAQLNFNNPFHEKHPHGQPTVCTEPRLQTIELDQRISFFGKPILDPTGRELNLSCTIFRTASISGQT